MQLVCTLFPGIGLLDRAFEEEGFCVVRGPDLLWGGDIRRFHPPAGKFDGVIGGPPCQEHSTLAALVKKQGLSPQPDRIPEFERVVDEAQPDWFLMENVRGAPLPRVAGYRVHSQLVRDVWCGGETMRLRRFSFGTRDGRALVLDLPALHRPDPETSALASGTQWDKARGGCAGRRLPKSQAPAGPAR
jgi:DNA (cytosine-5)-methyltransferase 1